MKKVDNNRLVMVVVGMILIVLLGWFGIADQSLLAVYMIFVPFFFVMLMLSIGDAILFFVSLYFFCAIGIGNVLIYRNRTGYRKDGMTGVGTFDFSISSFCEMNSFVIVYFLTLYVILFVVGKKTQAHRDWKSLMSIRIPHRRTGKLIFLIIPLMSLVQIIMYSNKISVHGLAPLALPLHLWGGYWYFRMLVLPIIMAGVLLYDDTLLNWISTYIYIYLVSVCSLSRTTIILSCVPVFILMRDKRFYKIGLLILYVCSCIMMSDYLRAPVYVANSNGEWINIFELIKKSVCMLDIKSILLSPVIVSETLFQRMGGGYNVIQAGLVRSEFSVEEFVDYILHTRLSDSTRNALADLLRINEIYKGYNGLQVGYGLSYLGCIVLISQYNYVASIVHALLVSFPIAIMYLYLWHLRRKNIPIIFRTVANFVFIAGIAFFLFGGFNGFSVLDFYVFTCASLIALWIISLLISKFYRRE